MQILLDHGAEIDHKTSAGNRQSSVLGALANGRGEAAVYLAEHGAEIINTLIAAGAKVPPRHVPVNKTIDDLLRQYGSEPEPTWYWYGEKPRVE
jgi:hypothetical protein